MSFPKSKRVLPSEEIATQKAQDILSQDKAHCVFAPQLNALEDEKGIILREKARSSNYGQVTVIPPPPPKPPTPPKAELHLPKCKLREKIPSSAYGKKPTAKKQVYSRKPPPTFQPQTKGYRTKAGEEMTKSIRSSGYGKVRKNGSSPAFLQPKLRGEEARKKLSSAPKQPTFQPKLYISDTAKKLKEEVPSRLLARIEEHRQAKEKGARPRTAPMPRRQDGFVLDCVAMSYRRSPTPPMEKSLKELNINDTHVRTRQISESSLDGEYEYNEHGRRVAKKK
eukprot:m.62755 g.62755  ORF g.62755 m.62755 type:complete len:281 (-) comp11533_c0_seq1:47-889(-)